MFTIEKAKRQKTCRSCYKPIVNKELHMTTGPGGDSICMHCLKDFERIIINDEESPRGWHFVAPIKFEKQICSCCNEPLPIGTKALIIIYKVKLYSRRFRCFEESEKLYSRLCLTCIQNFNKQITEEEYFQSDLKRLNLLLMKENKIV